MTSSLHPLTLEQKSKLDAVLSERISISPDQTFCQFPLVHVPPVDLLLELQKQIQCQERVKIQGFRLNGSAAAYVIAGTTPDYNDLDLVVNVEVTSPEDLDYLREALMVSFASAALEKDSSLILAENKPIVLARTYIRKMIKVNQGESGDKDLWSMVALRNARGRNVEVKFVARLKRQFEFSVDSFQILLDDFMEFKKTNGDGAADEFPEISALSVWGAFEDACSHYREKVICTDNPEAIFGGGLLKYCRLRCSGYLPIGSRSDTQQLERYMCCRFFIDVPRSSKVEERIGSYLNTHFADHADQVQLFLQLLYDVVYRSSQCLVSKDRSEALMIIARLLSHYHPVVVARQSHVMPGGFCPIIAHYVPQGHRRSPLRIRPPNHPYMSRIAKVHTSSPATVSPFA